MINEKTFEVHDEAELGMLNLLIPYIEEAGYVFEMKRDISRVHVFTVTIKKASHE